MYQDNQYGNSNMVPAAHKLVTQKPYPNNYQPHLVASSRSESPLGNFSIARSTQTSVACMSSCNYYPGKLRKRLLTFKFQIETLGVLICDVYQLPDDKLEKKQDRAYSFHE